MWRITFLVTLVKTKQDCLEKLLKTVRSTRRISELVRQRVPDRRTGVLTERKKPRDVWLILFNASLLRLCDNNA